MAIQTIGTPVSLQSSLSFSGYNSQKSANSLKYLQSNDSSGANVRTSISSEYYSSEKYAFDYTSDDGDRVSFSYEAVTYQSSSIEMQSDGSSNGKIKELQNSIKQQLREVAQEIVKNSMKNAGIDVPEEAQTSAAGSDIEIPEYWNAENTSQRIVDFAISFYGAFEGAGEEFLSKIKAAIEDGFTKAGEFRGDAKLPDSVQNLVNSTHDLIMKKLDDWAVANKIGVQDKSDKQTEIIA